MNILIPYLNENATRFAQEPVASDEAVAKVSEIGMNAEFPSIAESSDLFRLSSRVLRLPILHVDQQRRQWQGKAAQTGSQVSCVGEGYHAAWLPVQQLHLIEVDSDHWKTWVHQRLSTPLGSPGAMTLFQALPQDHLSLAKHLTA